MTRPHPSPAALSAMLPEHPARSTRTEGTRWPPHSARPVLRPAAGRELLDIDSLSANPRAHRATHVASDVIDGSDGERDRSRRACPSVTWSREARLRTMPGQPRGRRENDQCDLWRMGSMGG